MTELRISITNTSPTGGTYLTPVYFGFHDGSFDLFDAGEAASPGLEQLAEDGAFDIIAGERLAVAPESQGIAVTGAQGPIETSETTSAILDVNGDVNTTVAFGAMILPSNDAFIGTDEGVVLFDEDGNFLGAQEIVFLGTDVYDAGTEVNTELDAAFINQMGPNTGVDENGVVALHPGFNGSLGNPVGDGDQIILGGTNAFGDFIDPTLADFTQPGAEVATVHINTVREVTLEDGGDFDRGSQNDDLTTGGSGADRIGGRAGWDELDGGGGSDLIFGGRGNDIVNGGDGQDIVNGGVGDDTLDGGAGNDLIIAGAGDDFVFAGEGDDTIFLGRGDDEVFYSDGDGTDIVNNFRNGDSRLIVEVEGFETAQDVLDVATETSIGVEIDFGDGAVLLTNVTLEEFGASDIFIA